MPVCCLCSNETFNEMDGLYYCHACGTQSQDIRDEETADMVQDHNPRLRMKEKKGESRRKDRHFEDKGKPWVMCEAYQFVIKAQVEALIKLGVNPKLKEVVGQIWFKYLQNFGIAFQNAPEGSGVSVNVPFSARDASIFGHAWKTDCHKKRTQESVDDQLELCSQLSKEEFYDEDNPYIKEEDKATGECPTVELPGYSGSESESDDSEAEFVGSIGMENTMGQRVAQIHQPKMSTMLAFPYLGLLFLNEPVFLSDLLRWTREGHIPLFRIIDILPGYMKLKETDSSHLYLLRQVNRQGVMRAAGRVAQAIRLPKFPEPDIPIFTSRFIVDLQLPALLHGCVRQLLQIFRPRTGFNVSGKRYECTLQHNEENAMAYIMVALKLCYGLNDSDESFHPSKLSIETEFSALCCISGEKPEEKLGEIMYRHSSTTAKIKTCLPALYNCLCRQQANLAEETEQTPTENSLPLFEDWFGGFKGCFAKRARNGVPWSKEELSLLREPSNYGTFCKTDVFGKWIEPDLAATEERSPNLLFPLYRAFRLENREKRAELFHSLTSDSTRVAAQHQTYASSFPTTCRHATSDDDGRQELSQGYCSRQACYAATSSRRVAFEKLHPRGESSGMQGGTGYLCYLRNDEALKTVHHSYKAVLQILASRIETTPEVLHKRVKSLEHILFSDYYSDDKRACGRLKRFKLWF